MMSEMKHKARKVGGVVITILRFYMIAVTVVSAICIILWVLFLVLGVETTLSLALKTVDELATLLAAVCAALLATLSANYLQHKMRREERTREREELMEILKAIEKNTRKQD